jgi:hypothetical protein
MLLPIPHIYNTRMQVNMRVCVYIYIYTHVNIMIEGRVQVFQLFFRSTDLVLKTVESCFVALNNYFGIGSI